MKNRGVILIAALWIVAILAVFAVSVGRRSAISLKLISYDADSLKAYFIARAGIMRVLAEKNLEYESGLSLDIDALSESWANNKELFDNKSFGSGTYTVGYNYEEESSDESPPILYGLMDEQSKISINSATKETLANLIGSLDIDETEAEEIAAAIIDWRDEDSKALSEDGFEGAEDEYYQALTNPYYCKSAAFDNIYELTAVRGIEPKLLNKLTNYITTYGDGKVNINTAGEVVLDALFGPEFPNLSMKIIRFRRGGDDIIGTSDDRWFSFGNALIEREEGLVEIKNLQDAQWYANIYGITTEEYNRIRELIGSANPQLSVKSTAYRAIVVGEVDRVRARLVAVYELDNEESPITRFWYQE